MKPLIQTALATAAVLWVLDPSSASAQLIPPFGPQDYYHDMQLFAPVELDFGNEPAGRAPGYFFGYDRLYWALSGERAQLGDPNVMREAITVYYDNIRPLNIYTDATDPAGQPVDQVTGNPINPDTNTQIFPYLQMNTITSTLPDAAFGWGNRYEFGYQGGDGGWVCGIIERTEQSQVETFGLQGGQQREFGGLASPLGDTYIAFRYQEGLMHGFIDLIDGAFVNGGAVLPTDSDGDGILDGDGIADDIDADGQFGPNGFDIDDPPGVPDDFLQFPAPGPDGIIGTDDDILIYANVIPDYDDLVELPTSWNRVVVRNVAKTDGVELMRTHVVNNRHMQQKFQNNHFEIYYGARYLRLRDAFRVDAEGGVLGQSFWDTHITNNLVGPQIGAQWLNQRGRWSTVVQGRFMFGYNVSNWDQQGAIGEDFIPGQINSPLYLGTTYFQHGRSDNDFSPVGELRVEGTYRLTKAFALKAGYTGLFVDNIHRASTSVDYVLPKMGFITNNSQSIFINGLTFGLEFNH